jgi:uncharacterized membrane protein
MSLLLSQVKVTWYSLFKSIHVIAAVIWVGGAAMIQAYAFRILRTGDGRRQADFSKDTEVVGMPMLVVMLLGIAAVLALYARGAQQVPISATQ